MDCLTSEQNHQTTVQRGSIFWMDAEEDIVSAVRSVEDLFTAFG